VSEQVAARPRGGTEAFLVALAFFGLAVGMVVLGARNWLPDLASRHGAGIDRMLIYLLFATGLLVAGGHFVLGYFVWRSSRKDKVTLRMASPRAERLWSIIPGLIMTIVAEGGVLAIGLPVWSEYFVAEPPANAVSLEVTAEQFAWNIRYPGADGILGRTDPTLIEPSNSIGLDYDNAAAQDDIVRVNRIYLPVDRPARILLRSKDVIHSFFLPELRVKQDVVPGMNIEIWFVPTVTGQYELACTELCGLAHYYMKGFVDVLPQDEFDRWLAEAAEEG